MCRSSSTTQQGSALRGRSGIDEKLWPGHFVSSKMLFNYMMQMEGEGVSSPDAKLTSQPSDGPTQLGLISVLITQVPPPSHQGQ